MGVLRTPKYLGQCKTLSNLTFLKKIESKEWQNKGLTQNNFIFGEKRVVVHLDYCYSFIRSFTFVTEKKTQKTQEKQCSVQTHRLCNDSVSNRWSIDYPMPQTAEFLQRNFPKTCILSVSSVLIFYIWLFYDASSENTAREHTSQGKNTAVIQS